MLEQIQAREIELSKEYNLMLQQYDERRLELHNSKQT